MSVPGLSERTCLDKPLLLTGTGSRLLLSHVTGACWSQLLAHETLKVPCTPYILDQTVCQQRLRCVSPRGYLWVCSLLTGRAPHFKLRWSFSSSHIS